MKTIRQKTQTQKTVFLLRTLVISLTAPILLALFTLPLSAADLSATQPADPHILMKFPMDPGVGRGDHILIPAKVGPKETFFVLDTGATRTAFDLATEGLGSPIGNLETHATTADIQINTYHAPPLQILGHDVSFVNPVLGMDFKAIREASGLPITGILGMDFLANYILKLDFKNHQILLLDPTSQPPEKAESFRLGYVGGRPAILIDFLGVPHTLVLIDTGDNRDGGVRPLFLETSNISFTTIHSTTNDATGHAYDDHFKITPSWTFAGTHFNELHLNAAQANDLGLRFLANYVVTFDFPHDLLYLESIRDQHPAPLREVGFNLIVRDGKHILTLIDKRGLSYGLQKEDELLSINGQDTSQMPVWQIYESIDAHPTATLRIRRENKTLECIIPPINK